MTIESVWEDYFREFSEGLGTTYERFIVHQYFERLEKEFQIKNVLESPSFGITGISGINSMWWASHKVPVTVVDCEEKRIQLIQRIWRETGLEVNLIFQRNYNSLSFRNRSFDLSWSFCALGFIEDAGRLLEEMARVTRKVIFVCLPNRRGIALRIRNVLGKDGLGSRVDGDVGPERVITVLKRLGWECGERGYFDVPPWPDIAMKKEEFLRRMGMGSLARILNRRNERPISIIDYFKGTDKDLEINMKKYSFLEKSPTVFKKLWAHHEYLLFSPKSSGKGQSA